MPLQNLTEEQVQTWTRAQKDRWWFEHVYRGDMAQLSVRAALTGFLLGFVLTATALYIGGKTGISIGVGLTSVILTYAMYRLLAQSGLAGDFTILENNATQSVATAAGYMITPYITCMPAYMIITDRIIPGWQMMVWTVVVAVLGVLVAFPLKRRFINDEQQPFPEGRACGVVLDALYYGNQGEGLFRAKVLAFVAVIAGFLKFLCGDGLMRFVQFKLLRLDQWAGLKEPWYIHERLDDYFYVAAAKYHWWVPKILGTDFRVLGLRFTFDTAMMGIGGLMGIRVSVSVLLGAVINFVVLAPLIIQRGEIAPRLAASGATIPINRAEIVNQWSLWWGVTIMVVGSLVGLFAKPEIFRGLFGGKKAAPAPAAAAGPDVLAGIELQLWLSYVGVPVLSLVSVWLTHLFFGVPVWLALVSLPLVFVLTVICVNSMALTSWTPTGSLAKITQFTIGAIDRSNPATNLMTGGITASIASNAANLLSDIKPGYMLGAKPRQQALGHIIGIAAGALACGPLFYLLFLPPQHVNGEVVRTAATIVSDRFAQPAALQWVGVSQLIAHGLKSLPASAVLSMAVAAVCAVVFEVMRILTKGRFPLSSVSIGLGVVLPPESSLFMFLGAFLFWVMGRRHREPGTPGHRLWVDCMEPICAGLISGAALVGIADALAAVLLG
jgi:uncharacterized oligopeptide transporter (OPT) family protein